MSMKKVIILFVFACIAFSCKPTLYMPSSTDAVQQQQLLTGRNLYIHHCSSCHNLHFPKEFASDEWKTNINKMQKRAKITDDEKELILNYLQH